MRRRCRRLLLVGPFAAVLLSLLTGGAVVLANAPFDHATPAPEQVVATAPVEVDIYTKVPTSPAKLDTQAVVTGPDGKQADLNESSVDPADHRHIIVPLKPNLAPGRYVVSFKTRGEADLEHDGGAYAFYVGVPPTPADRAADSELQLTNPDQGLEDVSLQGFSGYRRGLVEGGVAVIIVLPAVLYFAYRRRRHARQEDGVPGGPPAASL